MFHGDNTRSYTQCTSCSAQRTGAGVNSRILKATIKTSTVSDLVWEWQNVYATHCQAPRLKYEANITSHSFFKDKSSWRLSEQLAQHPLANRWKHLRQESYRPCLVIPHIYFCSFWSYPLQSCPREHMQTVRIITNKTLLKQQEELTLIYSKCLNTWCWLATEDNSVFLMVLPGGVQCTTWATEQLYEAALHGDVWCINESELI